MRAITQRRYGSPAVLAVEEIDRPQLADDGVLVRVQAASVNPYDWHHLTGTPYLLRLQAGLRRPSGIVPGVDLAGEVVEVGRAVTRHAVGDRVVGTKGGAFADLVAVPEARLVRRPAGLAPNLAAAIPMAGTTALQGLRDKGGIEAGQSVLVNGASGGVGTFAVQIAKAYGAEVTAVCSTRNAALVRSLGADHVVDYTVDDFTRSGRRHDLVLDTVGSRSLTACRRILAPTGTLVSVGRVRMGRWAGPLLSVARTFAASRVGRPTMVSMLARTDPDDLRTLLDLVEEGRLRPVVDRRYPMTEVADALAYVGLGHAQGKVVLTW